MFLFYLSAANVDWILFFSNLLKTYPHAQDFFNFVFYYSIADSVFIFLDEYLSGVTLGIDLTSSFLKGDTLGSYWTSGIFDWYFGIFLAGV